jgi:hypothetical protein
MRCAGAGRLDIAAAVNKKPSWRAIVENSSQQQQLQIDADGMYGFSDPRRTE